MPTNDMPRRIQSGLEEGCAAEDLNTVLNIIQRQIQRYAFLISHLLMTKNFVAFIYNLNLQV
jgi:hypothetical protein